MKAKKPPVSQKVQAYPLDKQSTSKPIKGKEMVKIRFSGKSDPKYAGLL